MAMAVPGLLVGPGPGPDPSTTQPAPSQAPAAAPSCGRGPPWTYALVPGGSCAVVPLQLPLVLATRDLQPLMAPLDLTPGLPCPRCLGVKVDGVLVAGHWVELYTLQGG